MVFLSTSEEEFQWEEERKVMRQKRRLILNRSIAIFMVVLVVALGTIFVITRVRPQPPARTDQQVKASTYVRESDVPDPVVSEDPVSVISEPATGGTGEVASDEPVVRPSDLRRTGKQNRGLMQGTGRKLHPHSRRVKG